MEIFNITPQTMLVVAPARAAVPGVAVLSTQDAVAAEVVEHAAPVPPHTHCPPLQTLPVVPVHTA